MELREMAEELLFLKDAKDMKKDELKGINKAIEEIEGSINLAMLNTGQSKVSFPGVGTISPMIKSFPRILDKDVFYNYLRETHQDGLIQETVNARSLGSWFKEKEFDNADEYLIIGLDSYDKTTISLRRS